MKVIAVNGSPRKTWNTATLLERALDGASSRGAAVGMVHLYDLDFKGCISCFACKRKGGDSYGRCAVRDGLTTLLAEIEVCGAVVLGSPIYFGAVTGEMRCFLERWLFPYLTYTDPPRTLFPGKIRTAFIYTMNMGEEELRTRGMADTYDNHFSMNEAYLSRIFGHSTHQLAMDTLQFDDYSKYVSSRWDPADKVRSREEVFPVDCDRAYALGAELAQGGRPGSEADPSR